VYIDNTATTGGKSNVSISLRYSDQSVFASAYFEEAPISGLGQGALSLIGLLSHARTNVYSVNAMMISTYVPMLTHTLTWMDGFLGTIWVVTRAYRYHISWCLRQVIDANCLYNGEQHAQFVVWIRPNIIVTNRSPIVPRCRPNPNSPTTTR
jgi:hypothetical protein